MEFDTLGKGLMTLGVGLVVVGAIFFAVSRLDLPGSWRPGNLPGDIRVQGSNFACFAPIMTMCLLSLVLTIVLNVVARLINR